MKTLDYAGFRDEIKRGVSGGYLFCGEEAYLMRHSISALRKSMFGGGDDAFNHIKIDATADRNFDLSDAITQLPVFADARLVELWGFDFAHAKAEACDPLLAALAELPDNPQTVFVMCATPYEFDINNRKPSKAHKQLTELLTPVIFSRESPAALAKWCAAHFAHEGVTVDRPTVQALIARVGGDMFTLSGEIGKLCAYACARGDRVVTERDVLDLCALRPEIGAFDFANAVLDRNVDRAIFILEDGRKHKEDAVSYLATILHTYARMYNVLVLADNGKTPAEIGAALKMKDYPVRTHLRAARALGEKRVTRALRLCAATDTKVKSTSIDPYVAISRLICILAAI